MSWESFMDAATNIDDAYMTAMGALVGYRDDESEIHDAYAMLFGYSL